MRRTLVIHPFLFAVFPVLFLFAQNIHAFSLGVVVKPIFLLVAATVVLLGLSTLILRNSRKAGLVVSVLLVLFFSYGPVWQSLPRFRFMMLGVRIEPTKTVFIPWVILFVVFTWLAGRTKRNLHQFTRIINVTAAVLVAISVFNIAVYEISGRERSSGEPGAEPAETGPVTTRDAESLPDIYYIIMDGYGRQDVLKELYDYDNTHFIEYLKQKGFYVAERSASNYPSTALCLSSILNLEHLSNLIRGVEANSNDCLLMAKLIKNSLVLRFLKNHGYTTIAFASGYDIGEIDTADIYLKHGWFADEFQNALLHMTPVPVFLRRLSYAQDHRTRVLYILDHLERVAERKSPKFVFAHVLGPHRPFVFGPRGEAVNPQYINIPGRRNIWVAAEHIEDYRKFYRDQLTYLNMKLERTITAILRKSARPPILLLQGDHGPCSLLRPEGSTATAYRERFAILNAWYLPGKDAVKMPGGLYPQISPVNSFRVVFNNYFGKSYEMLKDDSYYSLPKTPYSLTNVTDMVRKHVDSQE